MTDKTLSLVFKMNSLSFGEHCYSNAECFCHDLQLHKDRTKLAMVCYNKKAYR